MGADLASVAAQLNLALNVLLIMRLIEALEDDYNSGDGLCTHAARFALL